MMALALAWVCACQRAGGPSSANTAPSAPPTRAGSHPASASPSPSAQEPLKLDHFYRLCTGEARGFPTKPYRGPGPHRIVLVPRIGANGSFWTSPDYRRLPAEWDIEGAASPYDIELVACMTRTDGAHISNCLYKQLGNLKLHLGHYSVVVKETSTGTEVARFEFDATARTSCPPAAFANTTLSTSATPEELAEAFRAVATATV
ncbi:hypothetical protein [Yinghuangia soli]|uniref:Uncharacterized protein n=1 Tax=Yinghuangia soli TaxID=2908204 RepID=A0AA41PZ77_9ACTN|nr:hypothetical protein [Yinghuangia soli]MCF2527841.1 hypothetical protein [Yinghuangia soli]